MVVRLVELAIIFLVFAVVVNDVSEMIEERRSIWCRQCQILLHDTGYLHLILRMLDSPCIAYGVEHKLLGFCALLSNVRYHRLKV